MIRNGYVRIGGIRGADVCVHVAVLLVIAAFGLFYRSPMGLLGYVVVILVHELGHAGVAWAFGLRVRRIAIHVFGGSCAHDAASTELQSIAIAWGGVLAQLVLFGVAYGVVLIGSPFPDGFMTMLLGWNLGVVVFNLLPLEPFDGAVAWRIVPYAFDRLRFATTRKRRFARDLTIRRPEPGPFHTSTAPSDDLVIDDDEFEALAERLRVARSATRDAETS